MERLRRGAAAAAAGTLLAAGLMLGAFAAGQARAKPLEPLPAPSPAAGWGHPEAEGQIDINSADAQTLTALPGIGPARAAAIVAWREEHGPFRYPEELLLVEGIGEGILADILDRITVGGG